MKGTMTMRSSQRCSQISWQASLLSRAINVGFLLGNRSEETEEAEENRCPLFS